MSAPLVSARMDADARDLIRTHGPNAEEYAWQQMDSATSVKVSQYWGALCLVTGDLWSRLPCCAGCGGTGSDPDGVRCSSCKGFAKVLP